MISIELQNDIKCIAQKNLGFEQCGLLIETEDKKTIVLPCRNISSHPRCHFEIHPFDYIRGSRIGKIIGYWHSQENYGASPLDEQNSFAHNLYSVVYSWKEDKFFEVIQNCLQRYIGRPFEIGKEDCFSLVREYYKNELNINIGDYIRNENWYKENPKIIEENFKKEGFKEIEYSNIKKNDIIFFDLLGHGNIHHMGIYVGFNDFLHNPRNSHSLIEFLSNTWIKKILKVIRWQH